MPQQFLHYLGIFFIGIPPLGSGAFSQTRRFRRVSITYDASFFEFDYPVRYVVVAVIMADYKYRLAAGLESRKQMKIEDVLEVRVLVGRPFIKQINRAVLEKGGYQGQPFPLSLR